jgi:hypothetical protein
MRSFNTQECVLGSSAPARSRFPLHGPQLEPALRQSQLPASADRPHGHARAFLGRRPARALVPTVPSARDRAPANRAMAVVPGIRARLRGIVPDPTRRKVSPSATPPHAFASSPLQTRGAVSLRRRPQAAAPNRPGYVPLRELYLGRTRTRSHVPELSIWPIGRLGPGSCGPAPDCRRADLPSVRCYPTRDG